MKMADLVGVVYGEAYWDREPADEPTRPQKYMRKSKEQQRLKALARAQRSYEKRREKILMARAAKRGAVDFVPSTRGRYTPRTAGMSDVMHGPTTPALARTGLDG